MATLLKKINSGQVREVMIEDKQIYFTADNEKGQQTTYQTGAINDPQLVDRLLQAKSPNQSGKIAFNQIVPRENSPILNFILMWILPGLLFYIIWKQTSKSLQARLGAGGNFMSFGNSGANPPSNSVNTFPTSGSVKPCIWDISSIIP